MFRHRGQFYVIAHRNIPGPADRGHRFLPDKVRKARNLFHYSLTRKRTTLHRIDLEGQRLVPILDLPSRCDTAFAWIPGR